MSYNLEISAPLATWEEAMRLEDATRGPGLARLRAGRRKSKQLRKTLPPSVHVDWETVDSVLDDQASWDERAFTLSDAGRTSLAATVEIVGRLVLKEWTLRSYWIGDEVEQDVAISADDLAELCRASALDRYILYRVVPAEPRQGPP